MAEYEARRVDLRTLSLVAAIYGLTAQADALYEESCGEGGKGPGMTAGQMTMRINELGLPATLYASRPGDDPREIARATAMRWCFLARMKGYAGQDGPIWGIAEWQDGLGVGILIHMPPHMEIEIPPPFADVWTGQGIIIRKDHGHGSLT